MQASRSAGRCAAPAATARRQRLCRSCAVRPLAGQRSATAEQPCSHADSPHPVQAGMLHQQLAAAAQQAARVAAALAASAVLALGSAAPPAEAVLNNPRAPVPRSADVALRRSIPAFNQDVREVQTRLEAIGFKLRIPQRKPWQAMADDAAAAAALVADRPRMLTGVLRGDEGEAEQLIDGLQEQLERLARSIEVKDPDRTSVRVANALEQVAALELLQAPGLPYQLPRQVAALPALTGRAVVELTVEKASGQAAFVDPNSAAGPQPRSILVLVLDGYSAPITAANLAANFQSGLYDGARLSVSGVSVLAGQPSAPNAPASGTAAGDGSEGAFRGVGGGRRSPPPVLPLEILAAGDFEPLYRTPLDVRSGELPVLPLSIYGAVAMANLPDDPTSGFVSATQFFIYKFDRTQAGLAGLSFEEGEFGVCGYVVKGLDAVGKLEDGDRIVSARVVSGLDKLSVPS